MCICACGGFILGGGGCMIGAGGYNDVCICACGGCVKCVHHDEMG